MHGAFFLNDHNARPATNARVGAPIATGFATGMHNSTISAAGWPMPIWRPDARLPALPAGFPRAIAYPPQPAFAPAFTFQPPPSSPVNNGWSVPPHFIPIPYETYRKGVLASSTAVSAAISTAAPPTLPSIHEVVRPKRRQGCTISPLAAPFFKARSVKAVPPSTLVMTGPRWFDEPEFNISWCILPTPKCTWPTQGVSQDITFAGASQSEAEERTRSHLMSVSDLLNMDPDLLDAVSPAPSSPPSSPSSSSLSSLPDTPAFTGHLTLGQRDSTPLSSANSSDEEPLMAMARKKIQLPAIATLNLPKPSPKNAAPRPAAGVRPVAGRRPVNVESSESESSSREFSGSSSLPSSSMSPLSSPSEMEVDELVDDDDTEYMPPSALSSKRKASPERPSQPPKKKRGPPPKRRHQCDECSRVFHYDSHYNKHKAAHAKKNGKKAKAFSCPKCNTGFGRIYDLQRHYVVHLEEETIFQCEYCDCVYTRQDALVRHMRKAGNTGEHPPPLPKKR